ncbi:class I SAM-dependent methyltransferase [Rhodopila sp.]|uniref:class I SAM-dependent methyltransferase n=1 Tax=Rhodopila sp. TaxID=2480087 RepID=UPI003D12B9C4
MFSTAVRSWFGRTLEVPPVAAAACLPDAAVSRYNFSPAPEQPPNLWPAARLAVTSQLWGKGFNLPGGEVEILQLTRSLGLSSASSLLLIGVGAGGPASSIVRNLGAWVTGLEVDPALVKEAKALMKAGQIANKAKIEAWDPENPRFGRGQHHHCLAIEPLRAGGQPEPIIDSLAQTLKTGGQLVMIELVADAPLLAGDPTVSRWARLEHRTAAAVPTANGVTRMLTRVGFDVRIAEDISDRHMHNAMIGWRVAVRDLRDYKPAPPVAAQLVAEAEIWLLRVKLLREKRLRMMRWHAIGRASSAVASPRPA